MQKTGGAGRGRQCICARKYRAEAQGRGGEASASSNAAAIMPMLRHFSPERRVDDVPFLPRPPPPSSTSARSTNSHHENMLGLLPPENRPFFDAAYHTMPATRPSSPISFQAARDIAQREIARHAAAPVSIQVKINMTARMPIFRPSARTSAGIVDAAPRQWSHNIAISPPHSYRRRHAAALQATPHRTATTRLSAFDFAVFAMPRHAQAPSAATPAAAAT